MTIKTFNQDSRDLLEATTNLKYATQAMNLALKEAAQVGIVVFVDPINVGPEANLGVRSLRVRAAQALFETQGGEE